jgi:hypothetical protein
MDPNESAYALKKQNSLWDAILQRGTFGALGGGPQVSPILGAQKAMQSRPYQMHVQEAQAMGQQPMSPEEFEMMQKQPRLLGR